MKEREMDEISAEKNGRKRKKTGNEKRWKKDGKWKERREKRKEKKKKRV